MSDLPNRALLATVSRSHPLLVDESKLSDGDIEILHAIAGARSAQHCNDLFSMAISRFGAEDFAAGEVDLKQRQRVVFYAMQWSERWRRMYLANVLQKDPMLRLMEDVDEPFTWGEWKAGKRLSAEERSVFELVGQHGWIDGFALPVPRSGSHIAVVSVVGKRLLDPVVDKRFLTHASLCYLERIRNVITPRDFPVPPLGLAPRELECLGLVARGYSDRRIAEALGLAVATAHEHVQRAMRRIGVTSRAEAVALAVSFGAIRV